MTDFRSYGIDGKEKLDLYVNVLKYSEQRVCGDKKLIAINNKTVGVMTELDDDRTA